MMFSNLDDLDNLLRSSYALQTLYIVVSEEIPPIVNVSKLEEVIGILETHEADIRRLRQNLSLRLRKRVFETYLNDMKKHEPALTA